MCTLPTPTVEHKESVKWKLSVSKMHFMCFDVGWITTCWWLTETVLADGSANFSPSLEGCARKARILPNAEGKGHLKLEDAFVGNHPFFKSRTKCLRGNLTFMLVNETCSVHFNNQHGNGLFCHILACCEAGRDYPRFKPQFYSIQKKQRQQLKQTATEYILKQ